MKPAWQKVKFGDVVRLNSDRCANPAVEGIERYVGLEHIDPDDLRIRRWGSVAEGTTFTNLFKPGQVLFGKRRAYQRKVAIAEFCGVCSSDIYVFEPMDRRLRADLLPFLCQTKSFFRHAVDTSAGSLSPRTNWSQLAQYEFALPPVEEQVRSVKVLSAASQALGVAHDCAVLSSTLIDSYRKKLSSQDSQSELSQIGLRGFEGPWPLVALGDLLELKRNPVSVDRSLTYQEIGVRSFGHGVFLKEPTMGASLGDKRVFWIVPERLIVNVVFAWEGAVAITGPETAGCVGSHRFPMFEAKTSQVNLEYLRHYLLTPDGLTKLLQASPGGAGRNRTLGQQAFLSIRVPLPPIDVQTEILDQTEQISKAERETRCRFDKAYALMQALITSTLCVE